MFIIPQYFTIPVIGLFSVASYFQFLRILLDKSFLVVFADVAYYLNMLQIFLGYLSALSLLWTPMFSTHVGVFINIVREKLLLGLGFEPQTLLNSMQSQYHYTTQGKIKQRLQLWSYGLSFGLVILMVNILARNPRSLRFKSQPKQHFKSKILFGL